MVEAAQTAGVGHFVYMSVAHPASIMRDYIAVRSESEDRLRARPSRDDHTTLVYPRPWSLVAGDPSTGESPGGMVPFDEGVHPTPRVRHDPADAQRVGVAVEHPAETVRVIEVPEIRRLGVTTA